MWAWGTWHSTGESCKCDGLCYEGSPPWFSWDDKGKARQGRMHILIPIFNEANQLVKIMRTLGLGPGR